MSVHPNQQHALGGILNNEYGTLLFAYKRTDNYPANAPYEVLKPLQHHPPPPHNGKK